MLGWCPGPDSNRHGVAPEGFSYQLQLSLLRARRPSLSAPLAHLWSGLYLHPAARLFAPGGLGGGRQVSTLSAIASRLSSVLQPP